jgi:hypothetical protein
MPNDDSPRGKKDSDTDSNSGEEIVVAKKKTRKKRAAVVSDSEANGKISLNNYLF